MSYEEYREDVEAMRKRIIGSGEKFFLRKNPNKKNEYDYSYQVGIGNEKEKLIDIHVAKVWLRSDAEKIVEAINAQ